VSAAVARSFPFAPGVCTPSDVERAVELGCRTLKFFPAEAAGGISMLKALIGPYGHLGIQFCPTGGINEGNLGDYLAVPEVAFVGGTWIAKKDRIRAGAWDEISSKARAAVESAGRS
jgi:2-dehydro-3-deoxyphosphogluconate aldolase/(4S)-4-hydroxy-2-oxoglutarate aldolase